MQVFIGSFIYSRNLDELEILHDTAVFVDGQGQIKAVTKDLKNTQDDTALEDTYKQLGWNKPDITVNRCKNGQFFFPGFIGMYLALIDGTGSCG